MDPVVVVGGGIVGASVAHHLREADVPVVLYERDALGGGTTADSAAMFVWKAAPAGSSRAAHRLRARSWQTYERLVDDGEIEFSRIGGLYLAGGADGLDRLRADAARLGESGVRAEVLDAAELERFGLAPAELAGGLHVPDEGYLDPAGIVQFLLAEARDAGARVETGTAVTDVLVEDGVVGVEVERDGDGECVPASAVVNAAGPWAPSVDATAGVDLPLRHNLGPILVLDHRLDVELPFVEFEDGGYVRGDGQGRAFAGRYGAGYDAADRLDPDAARSVDESFSLSSTDRFERYLPGLTDARVVNDWVGVRTITPDGRPLVGGTDLDGYHVATGMNGLGVTLAPAVGEHLASILAPGRAPDAGVREFLSPSRFG